MSVREMVVVGLVAIGLSIIMSALIIRGFDTEFPSTTRPSSLSLP